VSTPFVVWVTFAPREGCREAFVALVAENARQSRQEPGCRQFDVLLPLDATAAVALYEIYDDRAAFDHHVATPHYLRFKEASAGLVAGSTIHILDLQENCKPATGAGR